MDYSVAKPCMSINTQVEGNEINKRQEDLVYHPSDTISPFTPNVRGEVYPELPPLIFSPTQMPICPLTKDKVAAQVGGCQKSSGDGSRVEIIAETAVDPK